MQERNSSIGTLLGSGPGLLNRLWNFLDTIWLQQNLPGSLYWAFRLCEHGTEVLEVTFWTRPLCSADAELGGASSRGGEQGAVCGRVKPRRSF